MDEIDLEEFIQEGHVLVNAGLSHLRKALINEPIEWYALYAWLRGVRQWDKEALGLPHMIIVMDVRANLAWLNERLTPRVHGKPLDFVISADNYKE